MSDDATPAGEPDPGDFRIPTIAEIDAMRVGLGLSMAEMCRRAGFEKDRFSAILNNGYDPHTSTTRAFLDVLQEAEPQTEDEITRRGPKPKPSSKIDPSEYERLPSKLEAMDPDEVGDDPSPPDPDGLATDGGQCADATEHEQSATSGLKESDRATIDPRYHALIAMLAAGLGVFLVVLL